MGLDFLAHAYMNEILAYGVGAASLFGVVAPNSGNQSILVKYGTEEQKRKWLLPLIEGTMESGFSMTSPRMPARTRARSRRRRCEKATNGRQRPQVVHVEWNRRRLLHRDVPRRGRYGRARRSGQMVQIIVPTDTPASPSFAASASGLSQLRPLRVVYDDVRVPVDNALGQVGDGTAPHRTAGRGTYLPLHEQHRADVAGLRPHGRAHLTREVHGGS